MTSGARADTADLFGYTPYDYANEGGHTQCAWELQARHANEGGHQDYASEGGQHAAYHAENATTAASSADSGGVDAAGADVVGADAAAAEHALDEPGQAEADDYAAQWDEYNASYHQHADHGYYGTGGRVSRAGHSANSHVFHHFPR